MADIKTILRELSVATQLGLLVDNKKSVLSEKNPKAFLELAEKYVEGIIPSAKSISNLSGFDPQQKTIINNGSLLAISIFEDKHFSIRKSDTIEWVGGDTQKSNPADVIIGPYRFSLKEDSYILNNMGLYNYLTLVTGQQYTRGLHVFKEFACTEYNNWFYYTWLLLLKNPDWAKINARDNSFSSIKTEGNNLVLDFQNTESVIPTEISTVIEFEEHTNSLTREKVFAKWINDVASKDAEYTKLKKICAETAGKNICGLIKNTHSSKGIGELLQFCEDDYYYAKHDGNEISLFYVPSISNYENVITLDDVSYSVPKSQLNILTTFINKKTNNTFNIRNECRFSHGQFNGTPEAKMYYPRNEDLSSIYTPLNLL